MFSCSFLPIFRKWTTMRRMEGGCFQEFLWWTTLTHPLLQCTSLFVKTDCSSCSSCKGGAGKQAEPQAMIGVGELVEACVGSVGGMVAI